MTTEDYYSSSYSTSSVTTDDNSPSSSSSDVDVVTPDGDGDFFRSTETILYNNEGDNGTIFGGSSEPPPGTTEDTPTAWINLSTTERPHPQLDCTYLDYDYDAMTTIVSIALFGFGIFFLFFGYRHYKSTLFTTGFSFGLVIVWLICQVEDLLPQYGNVGIATLAGVLYGLICFLVPYVGFFTLGFHGGLLIGLASLSVTPPTPSIWLSVLILLGIGLLGAVANVCFPIVSIFSSSLLGGAAIAVSFDYFVEKLKMARWIGMVVRDADHDLEQFCWFSWLLLALWPGLLVVGVAVQYLLTARKRSEEIYGYHDSKRPPPRRPRLTREERALARQAKYRYLYAVRTAGGDYVSQAYMQFLQNKQPNADTLSTHMSTLRGDSNARGGDGDEGEEQHTTVT